ncbi:type II toxin-antitoxin system prevent-host-death family antitoxin [Limnohabitans sp. WS1]|uniref:type II toxin-antitoxin system prevent-host-death family antitoxin n=2 Tax=unclassified Limnohabitans TaxID=2626134 RepID=UPI000D3A1E4B|nr:hypothetical protein B9Z48_16120 [Limnohabitans sp. WS1]
MLKVSASPSLNRVAKNCTPATKKCELKPSSPSTKPSNRRKKGDFAGVFVYKFKLNGQETLLSYELQPHKNTNRPKIHAQLTGQVSAMHVISYTDARNSLKAVIDQVIDDQAPTLIHRREGGNAVILSEEAFSSIQETLYLLSSPANARALLNSVAQLKAGKAKKRKLLDI